MWEPAGADLYETVSNRFTNQSVTGKVAVTIPADSAHHSCAVSERRHGLP